MSTFNDSFVQLVDDDDSLKSDPISRNFDHDEGYLSYDHHIPSQPFDSFAGDSAIHNGSSLSTAGGNGFSATTFGSDFRHVENENGDGLELELGRLNDPVLPPSSEMEHEEGYALREWGRDNAILLKEKEKREKYLLSQIMEEADDYKVEFYRKREITCENNKITNRDREKLFMANLEKFHGEVDKDYWKAIVQLIPNEVAAIEKKKGKKVLITMIQGPKPGKPTDLSRMRQILVKLKHKVPLHLNQSTTLPMTASEIKDEKATVLAFPEAVAVA